MPTFAYEHLVEKLHASFVKGGFSEREAGVTANHLVDAESKGVPSHGLVRVPYYHQLARKGDIRTQAVPSVSRLKGAVGVVDGGGGLGIAAFEFALDFAMEQARRQNCFATAVVNCGHTGRLGAYVERAARNGFLAIALGGGGSGKDWSRVVPFGGTRAAMSTNPYALAMPSAKYGPVYADFATSAVAEGKIKVLRAKKERLPPGSIIDRDGQASDDPEAFYAGGALLPAAGPKGSGMAVIAELVGGAMLANAREFNWLLVLMKVQAFGNPGYAEAADLFLDRIKATPAAPGHAEVLLPGESETARAKRCGECGIEVADDIWALVAPEL